MTDLNRQIFRNIFYLTLLVRREWFLPALARLRESQYLPREELRTLQLEQLNSLVDYAQRNVPFYRDRLPKFLQSLEQLCDLPILTKNDLRAHAAEITHRHGAFQRSKTSGGSTGAPVTLLKDAVGAARELAAAHRGYEWAGVQIGDRQARFWGIPHTSKARLRAKLIDFVCHRRRISAFKVDSRGLAEANHALNRFQPDYFYGYVSALREFALFNQVKATSRPLQPRAIITTAEVLTSIDRNLLQTTFNARVFNEYGCGEVGTIAHECHAGALHVNAENLILEVLDEAGRPLCAGELGEFVVTDLTNYSTPLIRYRLGDFGALQDRDCSCGRRLPVITGLHGRAYDSLINTAGQKFHGEFFLYIAEDAKRNGASISGIQFIQNDKLDILVKLVCDEGSFAFLSTFISASIRKSFDEQVTVNFENVSSIPREASGKMMVVKRATQ